MIWFSCFCWASENFRLMPGGLRRRLDRLRVRGAPAALGADLREAEDDRCRGALAAPAGLPVGGPGERGRSKEGRGRRAVMNTSSTP